MTDVKAQYRREIEDAIGKARASRMRESVTASDGAEIYAYPKPHGCIAWGVNAAETGLNTWRAIRTLAGTDEAEG